ncbi:MAG TPA: hypothetical protein VE967_00735 [Gemmatimonadaceae bacterium]|nr:hypothetical protein [Gemmatimonadaceae bacterium]
MIVTLAALAGVIGACGSNDSTGPDGPGDPNTSAAGVFTLTKVDSKSLPFTVLTDSFYTLEVTSGTAVLDTAGHFIMPLTTRETVAGHASTYVDTTRGTWLQAAGVITLTVQPGATSTTAAWDGRHLTVGFAIGTATNNYVYTRN